MTAHLFECDFCGASLKADDMAIWWSTRVVSGPRQPHAFAPHLACRTVCIPTMPDPRGPPRVPIAPLPGGYITGPRLVPECGWRAEARQRAYLGSIAPDERGLVCDVGLGSLATHAGMTRLLSTYVWEDEGDTLIRDIHRKLSAPPAALRRDPEKWNDEDPVGFKRQRLVRWLMSYPRLVPLEKARRIASRKYPA